MPDSMAEMLGLTMSGFSGKSIVTKVNTIKKSNSYSVTLIILINTYISLKNLTYYNLFE